LELNISGDFNPITINKIRKFLSAEAIDIVICDFNKDVRLGGLAARLYGKTKVLWRLGLDITKNSFVHRHLTPRLVDGVVVPSEGLKRQIIRFGYLKPNDVTVIPHGIPDKEFNRPDQKAAKNLRNKYNLSENSIIAVTSGRFVTQKGHKYLVEAAPGILKRHPDLILMFMGDGHLENDLKSRIRELGIENHFVFTGMLENLDLELAGADLMLHPSIDEPFGFSVLEGMRAGLPVVASRVGGIPEVVEEGKTALLIESKKPNELIKASIELLDSPEMMTRMGLAGRERWQKELSEKRMVDRWEKYLNNLVSR
jgi:glycosyltransferase involved in cell wall biosynthesis